MRVTILVPGILIIVIGIAYILNPDSTLFVPGLGILGFGALDLALGLITRKGMGVFTPSSPQGSIKMIIDRGVIGSTIYLIAFSQSKIVLRRLTSGTVTILAVLVFALVGFSLGFIIGAAVGGITAFSLQEFLTERRREAALEGDLLAPTRRGDLQFAYDDIDRVQLTRSRLRLFLKAGTLGIVVSRKYPPKMRPTLGQLLPKSKMEE